MQNKWTDGMGVFTLTMLNIPDVGHGVGLALILETPHGRTLLYDTGCGYPEGEDWAGGHNSGRDLIGPLLEARGHSTIEAVIISHAHYDHFGGLLWLAEHWPIQQLIDSGYSFTGEADAHYQKELAAYERLREKFRARPGGYRAAQAGTRLEFDPELVIDVIAPPPGFFSDPGPSSHPDWNPSAHYLLNANSLILRIQHGAFVFLLPGDIEESDQARFLLPNVPAETLRCHVLIAPGHGLHTHPDFVTATEPHLVAVSLFSRWLAGCTAERHFRAQGAEVYITGRAGTITIQSDGRELIASTEAQNYVYKYSSPKDSE